MKQLCLAAISSVTLLACSKYAGPEYPRAVRSGSGAEARTARTATVMLSSAPGASLMGEGELIYTRQGVRAHIHVQHGVPGTHAVQVHERGDCSDIRGQSMGPDFAPAAGQQARKPLGYLGTIDVAADGGGELDVTVPSATLDNGPLSYAGKALVIDTKQVVGPGRSRKPGVPIACGVIQLGR